MKTRTRRLRDQKSASVGATKYKKPGFNVLYDFAQRMVEDETGFK